VKGTFTETGIPSDTPPSPTPGPGAFLSRPDWASSRSRRPCSASSYYDLGGGWVSTRHGLNEKTKYDEQSHCVVSTERCPIRTGPGTLPAPVSVRVAYRMGWPVLGERPLHGRDFLVRRPQQVEPARRPSVAPARSDTGKRYASDATTLSTAFSPLGHLHQRAGDRRIKSESSLSSTAVAVQTMSYDPATHIRDPD